MTKKEITIEEYNQSLETLTFIQNEKKLLKELYQTKRYQCHLSLPETLDELLLAIKKQNENLDLQINQIKKEILLNLKDKSQITKQKSIELNNLIEEFLNNIQTKNQNIPSNLTIIQNFSFYFQQITELISIKDANLFLENYILTLNYQELNAIKIKLCSTL